MASPWLRPGGSIPSRGVLALAFGLWLVPGAARAQTGEVLPVDGQVFAGGEVEQYLRVLQSVGEVPLYPWSVRGFGAREAERLLPRDSVHPWSRHYDWSPEPGAGPHVSWIPPTARVILNTGFPYGYNDGPVWAGRGLTTALEGGFVARYGPVSLVVDPVLFRAENAAFELAPVLFSASPYANPQYSTTIDLPQRFGAGAYARLDPGQSSVSAELGPVTFGLSTAEQVWGPAWDQPLILSDNAAGFPHAFLGTSHTVNLGVGRVHGRVVWGRLDESAYASTSSVSPRRFMSGLVGVFQPRGLAGLEIGGARFFHSAWPQDGPGWSDFGRPFESLLKGRLAPDSVSQPANQLASVFARWVFPASGVEAYGEYAREDHNWDLRDLLAEPDNSSGYTVGLARTWRTEPDRYLVFRAEVMNTQVTELTSVRHQTPFYRHGEVRQGHTQRGQLLGAASGFGGGKTRVSVERYRPTGSWSVGISRSLVDQFPTADGRRDVMYGVEGQLHWFLRHFDLTAGVTPVFELNRTPVGDAFNLNTSLGIRAIL